MRAFFMPEIRLKQKVIDPQTGDETMEKRTFSISENDPYNSIEFHKVCDVLGVKRFDRLDRHVSGKVAVIYNYLVHILKTNDVDKIEKAVDRFSKSDAGRHLKGKDLVDEMHKVVRLDMDAKGVEAREQMVTESAKNIEDDLKKSKDRAKQLRSSGDKVKKTVKEAAVASGKALDKRLKDFKKEARSKVDTSKAQEVKNEPEKPQEVNL